MWGFVTCVVVYYVICKYISPPTASFSEFPVFPPHTQEEEDAQKAGSLLVAEDGTLVIVGQPDSPDSGSIDKVGGKIETNLADEKV